MLCCAGGWWCLLLVLQQSRIYVIPSLLSCCVHSPAFGLCLPNVQLTLLSSSSFSTISAPTASDKEWPQPWRGDLVTQQLFWPVFLPSLKLWVVVNLASFLRVSSFPEVLVVGSKGIYSDLIILTAISNPKGRSSRPPTSTSSRQQGYLLFFCWTWLRSRPQRGDPAGLRPQP